VNGQIWNTETQRVQLNLAALPVHHSLPQSDQVAVEKSGIRIKPAFNVRKCYGLDSPGIEYRW
jgi:hypothetical protein